MSKKITSTIKKLLCNITKRVAYTTTCLFPSSGASAECGPAWYCAIEPLYIANYISN